MDARTFGAVLPTLFTELVHGSPDARDRTFILNQGDQGLLASLERLSAAEASASHGGPSVASHVDHLRYGLSLLNGWAVGAFPPWPAMDWTVSWRQTVVSEAAWRALRDELRREANAWAEALRQPRAVTDIEAGWVVGSVAHVAYHMGAIRQINRTTRGPSAEDEASAQAAQRTAST